MTGRRRMGFSPCGLDIYPQILPISADHVIPGAVRQSADLRRFNSGSEIINLRQSLSEKVLDAVLSSTAMCV